MNCKQPDCKRAAALFGPTNEYWCALHIPYGPIPWNTGLGYKALSQEKQEDNNNGEAK